KRWASNDCFERCASLSLVIFPVIDIFLLRYNSVALRKRLTEDVNFVWCLNTECDHGQTHPHGRKYLLLFIPDNSLTRVMCSLDGYPIVQCSWCYKKSCFTHKLPWHEGLTCAEFDSTRPAA